MTRWQQGEARIGEMLGSGELALLTAAAADGEPWLAQARLTLDSARRLADISAEIAWTFAYDAARFAGRALLAQQGLRPTSRGGHHAIEAAVRAQFGAAFDRYHGLRRQRDDIEYPVWLGAPLTEKDAQAALDVAADLAEAAGRLLPQLGLFGSQPGSPEDSVTIADEPG